MDFIIFFSVMVVVGAGVAIYLEEKKKKEMNDEERIQYLNKEAEERKVKEAQRVEKDTVRCPQCQSTTVQFMDNQRKGFSVGKAAAGGLLTGGIGTLAGFAGKKGKKDRWLCNECGYVFERKNK